MLQRVRKLQVVIVLTATLAGWLVCRPVFNLVLLVVSDIDHFWCPHHQRVEHSHQSEQPADILLPDEGSIQVPAQDKEHEACPLEMALHKTGMQSTIGFDTSPIGSCQLAWLGVDPGFQPSISLLVVAPKHSPPPVFPSIG